MSAPEDPATGSFAMLTPDAAVAAVEQTHGLRLDGTLFTYPSYVNRVYGVRTEEGEEYISKFYRPNRWSTEAILEEHEFLLDCVEAEIPVVPPIPDADGDTLGILEVTAATD
ncbi:MAG: serine/threonine protein kinase, partial [Spirochaetaceae bacterium]